MKGFADMDLEPTQEGRPHRNYEFKSQKVTFF